MCPPSRSFYLNSEGRGRRRRRRSHHRSLLLERSRPICGFHVVIFAVRRWHARAWPHLPHSSSPEDTAEFEVTATNLGERERWRDAYDFHRRIQLSRCQGIQKCFGITCDTYLHRYSKAHGAFIQPQAHTLLSSFTFGNIGH